MAVSKKTVRIITGVVLALMLLLAILFLMASTVPGDYGPFQLTQQERKEAAQDFINKHGAPLLVQIRRPEPFEHTITEDELNYYFASLEEIAFLKPAKRNQERKTSGVYEAMDAAGFADPAVRLDDGVMTLMVRSRAANKVISVDIGFDMTDDRHLLISIKSVRIGKLAVPQTLVAGSINTFKTAVGPQDAITEESLRDLDSIIANVIAKINDKPFPTEFKLGSKRLREIRDFKIDDGKLTVKIVPVQKDDKTADSPESKSSDKD
ncbi:MAG TPA: hypothetical protein PLK08_00065 [Phycisphaerae bacterium]|nr:hypothetical protein [Phycisphaerae bacterium]